MRSAKQVNQNNSMRTFIRHHGRHPCGSLLNSRRLPLMLTATILLSTVDARLNLLAPYTAIMGLAVQSSRWNQAMQYELQQAAKYAGEATLLQDAAAEDEFAAEELEAKATTEQEEAGLLEKEGESLIEKGSADKAKAATMEEQADELVAESVASESEATALFTEATAAETVFEEDTAQGTAYAAVAAESGTEAEIDEASTAMCQVIPLVDALCDVVGGIAAVGLETRAARAAVVAAEDFAAAAAAQVEADSATAKAAELEASAVEEEGESEALQSEAVALNTHGDEELEEGAADEMTAEDLAGKSALDENAAADEQAKALGEEDEAKEALQQSAQHGARACGNAIMMTFVSIATVLFGAWRILSSAILPVLQVGVSHLWNFFKAESNSERQGRNWDSLALSTSHAIQHGLLFTVFFGLWGSELLYLRQSTAIKSMGGIIVGFSASMAFSQALLLHALPRWLWHTRSSWASMWVACRELLRWLLVLFPLIVMEILLVWVNAGNRAFTPGVIASCQSWWLWVFVILIIALHYLYLASSSAAFQETKDATMFRCSQTNENEERQNLIPKKYDIHKPSHAKGEYAKVDQASYYGSTRFFEEADTTTEWEDIHMESESLESPGGPQTTFDAIDADSDDEIWLWRHVAEDWSRLRLILIFEILMASIMLALLRQSLPIFRELWPASRTLLMASHPHWHLFLNLVGVAAIVLLLCTCVSFAFSKHPNS